MHSTRFAAALISALLSVAAAQFCEEPADLPSLLIGTSSGTTGPALLRGYDGWLTLAGPLELTFDPGGPTSYNFNQQLQRVETMFVDWINNPEPGPFSSGRGGLAVGGKRLALRFAWVNDNDQAVVNETELQASVANATAVATRGSNASFAWAGFSSELTRFMVPQAVADGYLVMSGGAASTLIFSNNDTYPWAFGLLPSEKKYSYNSMEAISLAAEQIDEGGSTWEFASLCTGPNGCKAAIRIGRLQQEDDTFAEVYCAAVPGDAAGFGLDATGPHVTVGVRDSDEEYEKNLQILRDQGVNVVVGCITTAGPGIKLLEALHRMAWAPWAVIVNVIETEKLLDLTREPFYESYIYEFFLSPVSWAKEREGRGNFTNMTSQEFSTEYAARFNGDTVSWLGAAQWGAAAALCTAIERADSLERLAVAKELQKLELEEFYAKIKFDEQNQLDAPILLLQFEGNSTDTKPPQPTLVYPFRACDDPHKKHCKPELISRGFQFPTPPWPVRLCWTSCARIDPASGTCLRDGTCSCAPGWEGDNCEVQTQNNTGTVAAIGIVLGLLGVALVGFVGYKMWRFTQSANRTKQLLLDSQKVWHFRHYFLT